MVIPPILGEALLDVKKMVEEGVEAAMAGISVPALIVGFVAVSEQSKEGVFLAEFPLLSFMQKWS